MSFVCFVILTPNYIGDLLVTPRQCSDISVFHGHGGEDHAPGPTQQPSTADFGDLTHSMFKYSTPCTDVIRCVRVHPKRPKSGKVRHLVDN